jgi:hypothetical protein
VGDSGRLLSRQHAFEFALALIAAAAVAAFAQALAIEIAVAVEIVFVGGTVRQAWRQFMPHAQTEWSLTVGRFDRRELARRYVSTLTWRSAYHAACWTLPMGLAQEEHTLATNLRGFANLATLLCLARLSVAIWRHIAGSRVVPRALRVPFVSSRLRWWRLPAQAAITSLFAVGGALLTVLALRRPGLAYVVAAVGLALLYALVSSSEGTEADTEVALRAPRALLLGRSLRASSPSEMRGLLWRGTKLWWRWLFAPVAVLMLTEIVVAEWRDYGGARVGYGVVAAGALLTALLVAVLSASYRSILSRLWLLVLGASLLQTAIVLGLHAFIAKQVDSRELAAFVLAAACLCASAASPYAWQSKGTPEDFLRTVGIEGPRLRRIELLTGLGIGLVASVGMAAAFDSRRGVAMGAVLALACVLLQDRATIQFAGRRFTWRGAMRRLLVVPVVVCAVLGALDPRAGEVEPIVACAWIVLALMTVVWIYSWQGRELAAA